MAVVSELSGLVRRSGDPEALMDRPPEEVPALVAGIELDSYDDPQDAHPRASTLPPVGRLHQQTGRRRTAKLIPRAVRLP